MIDPKDLENRFSFHPATTDARREGHEFIRRNCHGLAEFMNRTLPDGRDKSLAITKLEEVMFWANAALARQD